MTPVAMKKVEMKEQSMKYTKSMKLLSAASFVNPVAFVNKKRDVQQPLIQPLTTAVKMKETHLLM